MPLRNVTRYFHRATMASRVLCATRALRNSFLNLRITNVAPVNHSRCEQLEKRLLDSQSPLLSAVRSTSFFNKTTAADLWKGCTSLSNAGMKRGRGKNVNKRNIRDLNRGQVIGVGRESVRFPGLNAPVFKGNELVRPQKQGIDPHWEENLLRVRDAQNQRGRRMKLNPLERGWSGSKMPGRSIGAPDPIGAYEFEDFDTRVMELKMVFCMKSNLGRARRQSAFVVVGNKQGLAGFAVGKSPEAKDAMRKAKNRAAQKLLHIPICDNHTVFHDFFCQFGKTKIYVSRKEEGYGLRCHRAIKTMCELIGIKDLYAKVEGPTGIQNLTKAFFIGLLQQRNFQQMADEKGLYVVEMNANREDFPVVRATPAKCRSESEVLSNESLDFSQHGLRGRVIYHRKKPPPFYTKLPSYQVHLKRFEKRRAFAPIKHQMMVRYGEIRSFLTEKYPEARPNYKRPEE